MAVTDRNGYPGAVAIASASRHETQLVKAVLKARFTEELPEKMIGDKAYDSDPLDEQLHQLGIDLIAPHKDNRVSQPTQDGRKLRRYRKRWKVERLFAWLQQFRRLITRFEYSALNFLSFVRLGCAVILLRRYF